MLELMGKLSRVLLIFTIECGDGRSEVKWWIVQTTCHRIEYITYVCLQRRRRRQRWWVTRNGFFFIAIHQRRQFRNKCSRICAASTWAVQLNSSNLIFICCKYIYGLTFHAAYGTEREHRVRNHTNSQQFLNCAMCTVQPPVCGHKSISSMFLVFLVDPRAINREFIRQYSVRGYFACEYEQRMDNRLVSVSIVCLVEAHFSRSKRKNWQKTMQSGGHRNVVQRSGLQFSMRLNEQKLETGFNDRVAAALYLWFRFRCVRLMIDILIGLKLIESHWHGIYSNIAHIRSLHSNTLRMLLTLNRWCTQNGGCNPLLYCQFAPRGISSCAARNWIFW